MGKIVSFWSPCGRTGKTTLMFVVLNRLIDMLGSEKRVLVVDMSRGYNDITEMFEVQKHGINMEDIVNFKINSGYALKVEHMLTKAGNVYFLKCKNFDEMQYRKYFVIINNIIDELREQFDVILFDTAAGTADNLTDMIIEQSDCLVNVTLQDREVLERSFLEEDDDSINVVNFYNDGVFPKIKELICEYNVRGLHILPYCGELQDMVNRGSIKYYPQNDTLYNRNISAITSSIMEKLGMKNDGEEPGRKKSLIMRLLLK